MVVDKAKQPGLQVAATSQLDEEGAFDIDVPELVGLASFVARTWNRSNAATAATVLLEELIDVCVADLVDLTSLEVGSDSLGVPVGRQPDSNDDSVHPIRYSGLRLATGPRFWNQGLDTAGLIESGPPEHASPRDSSR